MSINIIRQRIIDVKKLKPYNYYIYSERMLCTEMIYMKKKLGLVLGAGGARGIAHIGLLQAFEENGIVPDFISGCSAGAIVGACYCSGMSPEDIFAEVMKLKKNDIMDPIPVIAGQGLFSPDKMISKIRSVIGNKRICDLEKPFRPVATDLIKGELKIFEGRYDTAKAVAASACLPAVFEPVSIAGVQYIDGGVLRRLPVSAVREMEPDVVVAVDVYPKDNNRTEYKYMIDVLERAFELLDKDGINFKTKAETPDVFIQPDLGDMSQYTFKGFEDAYYKGYEAGIEYIKEIKMLLE